MVASQPQRFSDNRLIGVVETFLENGMGGDRHVAITLPASPALSEQQDGEVGDGPTPEDAEAAAAAEVADAPSTPDKNEKNGAGEDVVEAKETAERVGDRYVIAM